MPELATRKSPIHRNLETMPAARWGAVCGMPTVLHIDDASSEQSAVSELALADLSALRKLGVKGPASDAWLRSHGVDTPQEIYETRVDRQGSVAARLGSDEFLLESDGDGAPVTALSEHISAAPSGVTLAPRGDATFFLVGPRSVDVLRQTCAVNFAGAALGRVLLTRVAGVHCGVLPETRRQLPAYRLWVDPSYAGYLWEQLEDIVAGLSGRVVGAAAVLPELDR